MLAIRSAERITRLSVDRGSGCYLLIGVVVGDGVAAGAGVVLKVRFRIFQSTTKRIFIASSGGSFRTVRHFNDLLRDFSASPVTSVSPVAERAPLIKGLWATMQIAHLLPVRCQ